MYTTLGNGFVENLDKAIANHNRVSIQRWVNNEGYKNILTHLYKLRHEVKTRYKNTTNDYEFAVSEALFNDIKGLICYMEDLGKDFGGRQTSDPIYRQNILKFKRAMNLSRMMFMRAEEKLNIDIYVPMVKGLCDYIT